MISLSEYAGGDSSNQFVVRASDSDIFFNPFPNRTPCKLSKAQAINLAAWLMLIADPTGEEFQRVVKQIVKT